MGKRFVRAHDVDKRAIELHLALEAIKEMPAIGAAFASDKKKIYIFDKARPDRGWTWSVDMILSFDLKKTKENGGTVDALLASRRVPRPQPSQSEIDADVQRFLSGEGE